MPDHLNKPSAELVIDLVNKTGVQTPLAVGDVTFDVPVVVSNGTRNSSVVMRGVRANGFRGTRTVRYNRLDLSVAMPPTDGQTMEVMVPNDGFETKLEVCDRLNKQYKLQIGADDIVDGPVDTTVLPATTNIQAKPGSLAWFGSLSIEFVPDRPFYKDTFSTFVLDGLPEPTQPPAELVAPSYSIADYTTTANGEAKVSFSPRVGDGSTAVPGQSSDYSYSLALAGADDWCVLLDLGFLSKTTNFAETYQTQFAITAPDKTELVLKLVWDGSDYTLVNTAKALSLPVEPTDANGAQLTAKVSMKALEAHLGTITRSAQGVPLGSYTLRLQARRINTIAPRVLASATAKVAN